MNTFDKTVNIDTSKFTTYGVKKMLEDTLWGAYGSALHKELYVEHSWEDEQQQELFLYYTGKKHVATWNSTDQSGWIFC